VASRGEASGRPNVLRSLLAAYQFLTVAPVSLRPSATAAEVAHSMAYFPLVGASLGLALAALDWLFGLALVGPARVGLVVVALVLLTRALHLDGLMDSFDGLFGGWTPERRLEIMRDSRVGSFGALAAAGDLLLRAAALLAIPGWLRPVALVSALALGRWSLVYATASFPYARPTGLGAAYKARVGRLEVALSTLFAVGSVAAAFYLSGAVGRGELASGAARLGVLLGLAWVIAAGFGRYVVARLAGQTGDTYGATNELVEVAVLLAFGSPLFGLVVQL
jgi:adenosylcobinamide-GDP ribazoletransferase